MELIQTLPELQETLLSLDEVLASRDEGYDSVVKSFSFARSWVAIPHDEDWIVGFASFVGYKGQTGATYGVLRGSATLNGTKAEGRLKTFGGKSHGVGWKTFPGKLHSAAQAVVNMCAAHGKKPNALAEVYVIEPDLLPVLADSERSKIAMLVAALDAAELSDLAKREFINTIDTISVNG